VCVCVLDYQFVVVVGTKNDRSGVTPVLKGPLHLPRGTRQFQVLELENRNKILLVGHLETAPQTIDKK